MMKGVMKGKMMKKLKSIKPIEYLKSEKILQVSNFDGFVENFPIKPNLKPFKFPNFKEQDSKSKTEVPTQIDIDELLEKIEAEEKEERKGLMSEDELEEDKENIRPSISNQNPENSNLDLKPSTLLVEPGPPTSQTEMEISSFRRPDMNSGSLFDPKLLSAFHECVIQVMRAREEQMKGKSEKTEAVEEESQSFPLLNFLEKCPTGGFYSVILYTTSLRGIRKTFEDCHSVRFLLESFRVIFQQRDISIHSEFREELWKTLGEKCVPPRLFVMGRYIGGAEEVLSLHEQGRLKPLFEGVPRNQRDSRCEGCGGFRFVVCLNCNGSTRVFDDDDDDCGLSRSRCPECNENGLTICPYCC